jgi:Spy/CpxP family protein refolding chaperone
MMKKKIIIATVLAALLAVPVFAAATDQTQTQNEWFNQMFNNHKQMVQQAVDNGTITAEQAGQMNEHMQQMAPVMQKMMQNGGMMNSMKGNSGMGQVCGGPGSASKNK